MVFDKLFGWARKKGADPAIPFGRYSDNNKSVDKVAKWTQSETHFREKEFAAHFVSFFDYICDDGQSNVVSDLEKGEFVLYQGSKLIRGTIDKEKIRAEVRLVQMTIPSVPVMRRLLELNFNLYYSRYAYRDGIVSMIFDSPIADASPNKLYYGLKELATKSDKQDDLLLSEFSNLQPIDTDHIEPIPAAEKEIKYEFLCKWIHTTLNYITTLDQEKFSGGISYLLLTLVFRIDYLVSPQGKILSDLEKIASNYYGKDDRGAPERNPTMIERFNTLLARDKQEIFAQLFRSRYTFAIVPPHNLKSVTEAIDTALQNMAWYRDNEYPDIANSVMEYGFAFCQYSYSLPSPFTDFFKLFMQVNYSEYFRALGFVTQYYDGENNVFDEDAIRERITTVSTDWKMKYPSLAFKTKKLRFDTLLAFNQSFLEEVVQLNFE